MNWVWDYDQLNVSMSEMKNNYAVIDIGNERKSDIACPTASWGLIYELASGA